MAKMVSSKKWIGGRQGGVHRMTVSGGYVGLVTVGLRFFELVFKVFDALASVK